MAKLCVSTQLLKMKLSPIYLTDIQSLDRDNLDPENIIKWTNLDYNLNPK